MRSSESRRAHASRRPGDHAGLPGAVKHGLPLSVLPVDPASSPSSAVPPGAGRVCVHGISEPSTLPQDGIQARGCRTRRSLRARAPGNVRSDLQAFPHRRAERAVSPQCVLRRARNEPQAPFHRGAARGHAPRVERRPPRRHDGHGRGHALRILRARTVRRFYRDAFGETPSATLRGTARRWTAAHTPEITEQAHAYQW